MMGINDVVIHQVQWLEGRISIVKSSDPLLRRFGECSLASTGMNGSIEIYRQQADELLILLEGLAELELEDLRPESPTHQVKQIIELRGLLPEVEGYQNILLLPFGVSCRMKSKLPMYLLLMRLSTHEDGTHPADITPSAGLSMNG